ncbi:MAG: glucosaminidase domain-containing protein [Lachnospiraceae bacterium]|nr:glucosaminidase domain-containing protein [Lachnospiraceae bacterium]
MTESQFIESIGPIIQRHAAAYGYAVASPIIAQACCESAYGRSTLASKYHNYFGMKCGSGWQGKSVNMGTQEEYTPGTLTGIRDNFRAYDSMEEGVKGYFEFLKYPRYANLKTATTPLEYLTLIRADGYATSSSYVTTNMAIVARHNLIRFDQSQTPRDVSYAGIVTASALRVRSSYSTAASIVQVGGHDLLLPAGMSVGIIQECSGFGRLADIKGWVSLDYIRR